MTLVDTFQAVSLTFDALLMPGLIRMGRLIVVVDTNSHTIFLVSSTRRGSIRAKSYWPKITITTNGGDKRPFGFWTAQIILVM